jgi:hypothetical protein
MTADAFRHEHSFSSLTAGFIVFKQTLGHITKMFGSKRRRLRKPA